MCPSLILVYDVTLLNLLPFRVPVPCSILNHLRDGKRYSHVHLFIHPHPKRRYNKQKWSQYYSCCNLYTTKTLYSSTIKCKSLWNYFKKGKNNFIVGAVIVCTRRKQGDKVIGFLCISSCIDIETCHLMELTWRETKHLIYQVK